jgi:hypothetical protein
MAALAPVWRDKCDVLFPRCCVHCGGVVEGGRFRHLRSACAKLLFIVRPPNCTTCGQVQLNSVEHLGRFVRRGADEPKKF